ncbi:aldose 1-epimerase family protein [Pontiellaceae bacterium B12219]|nr:aldose 1-epimerase family protein [Pontiellaceae bacterium B12219]
MIVIENDRFKVGILKRGAELRSFYDKEQNREIMWQADPDIWGGSAPILFPIVGKLRDGKTTINGRAYEIPKHGLVRQRDAAVIDQGSNRVMFAFESDAETLTQYPFPFILEVEFKLGFQTLEVLYRIKNTGPEEMLFTIGSHPAFALDLEHARLEDYSIEFVEPALVDLHGLENGLLAKKAANKQIDAQGVQLSASFFEEDALIFPDLGTRTLRLISSKETRYLEFDTHGAPHLGLWAKPGAPYVCLEPWYSYDDAPDSDGRFENKPGILRLATHETFNAGYTIRIGE